MGLFPEPYGGLGGMRFFMSEIPLFLLLVPFLGSPGYFLGDLVHQVSHRVLFTHKTGYRGTSLKGNKKAHPPGTLP